MSTNAYYGSLVFFLNAA